VLGFIAPELEPVTELIIFTDVYSNETRSSRFCFKVFGITQPRFELCKQAETKSKLVGL